MEGWFPIRKNILISFQKTSGILGLRSHKSGFPSGSSPPPPRIQSKPESSSLPDAPAAHSPRAPVSRALVGSVQLRAIYGYSRMSKTNQRKGRGGGGGWRGWGVGKKLTNTALLITMWIPRQLEGRQSSRETAWFIRWVLQRWKDKYQLSTSCTFCLRPLWQDSSKHAPASPKLTLIFSLNLSPPPSYPPPTPFSFSNTPTVKQDSLERLRQISHHKVCCEIIVLY